MTDFHQGGMAGVPPTVRLQSELKDAQELIKDLEHRLRVLARAAVEDEQQIERLENCLKEALLKEDEARRRAGQRLIELETKEELIKAQREEIAYWRSGKGCP